MNGLGTHHVQGEYFIKATISNMLCEMIIRRDVLINERSQCLDLSNFSSSSCKLQRMLGKNRFD